MVGVAGKSKGCHTCRKRKIGCDQTKPACGQCIKTGRVCGGYERATVFLNHYADNFRPENPTSDTQKSTVRAKQNGAQLQKQDVSKRSHIDHHVMDTNGLLGEEETSYEIQQITTRSNIPKLIGFEHLQPNQALQTFLSHSLPNGAKEEVPLSWLYAILDHSKDVAALPLAISALSYGWAGHVDAVPKIVDMAHSCYIGALKHLHEALRNDPASQSDTLVATMECLALYEMFEFGTESETGWLAHLSGVETILQLRGPQMHIAGFGNKMFMFFRTIGIFKALICRKATFLAEGQWKHVPWTLRTKNKFHQYLDLAADVPSLLERADAVSSAVFTPDTQTVDRLLVDIAAAMSRMDKWARESGIKLPAGPPTISSPRSKVGPSASASTTDASILSQKKRAEYKYYIYSRLARQQTTYPSPTPTTTSIATTTTTTTPRRHRHNYPSKTPQDLGTPFDTLQSARLIQGLWTIQLSLCNTVHGSPRLRGALARLVAERASLNNYNVNDNNDDKNDPSSSSSPSSPAAALRLLSRPHVASVAEKAALWADLCTQNAWQSFGPVVALFTLRTVVRWFEIDRRLELESQNVFGSGRRYRAVADILGFSTTTAAGVGGGSTGSVGEVEAGAEVEGEGGWNKPFVYSHQAELDKCLDLLSQVAGFDMEYA